MAGPPSAQDVADALALTLERQDSSGELWCPPGDGIALRRWVTDRSASLGTGIRRAVRLARLMAMADRDYVRFLYARITALRTRHFRQSLQTAAAEGRLPRSVAILSDIGVVLPEPALAAPDDARQAFEIDFAQMPRLAALIDILHNALGFSVVADMLAPLLQPLPKSSANEVARALHAALNAWLGERLESPNHILQAQRIRAFLTSRGRVAPETVDDEGILLFWTAATEVAEEERVDGFKLYRSAAAAMLRYRDALRDAAAARQLEQSIGEGLENTDIAIDQVEASSESWQSPLRALLSPPANAIKWLNRKEQHGLLNYLGGPAEADEAGEDGSPWKAGLAGDARFDLAFRLTLLRVDVFGAAQASIVARLRKRAAPDEAIAQAMEPVDDMAYANAAAGYTGLSDQLRLESLAALASLMEAGAAEAVILLDHLAGPDAVKAVLGAMLAHTLSAGAASDTEAVRKRIGPALRSAVADPASVPEGVGRDLLLEAVAAARKVNRAGFRREDRADHAMQAALQAGAAAVVEVARELARLTEVISAAPPGDSAADRSRFFPVFRRIYLAEKEN
jgi:hypothetical protein